MSVKYIQDFHAAFTQAYNNADRAALLAFYTPDALFMAQPGQPATGPALAAALDGFLALKGTLQMRTLYLVEAGDVALASAHWTLHGIAPDGNPVTLEGKSIEVLRRQTDGSWLYAIDHPFGA